MGAVTSDLSQSLKAQAGALSGNMPLYKLVGVSGDGELIRLTRICMRTKNFNELDSLIRTNVVKYLYNEGKGELVKIQIKTYATHINKKRIYITTTKFSFTNTQNSYFLFYTKSDREE